MGGRMCVWIVKTYLITFRILLDRAWQNHETYAVGRVGNFCFYEQASSGVKPDLDFSSKSLIHGRTGIMNIEDTHTDGLNQSSYLQIIQTNIHNK